VIVGVDVGAGIPVVSGWGVGVGVGVVVNGGGIIEAAACRASDSPFGGVGSAGRLAGIGGEELLNPLAEIAGR